MSLVERFARQCRMRVAEVYDPTGHIVVGMRAEAEIEAGVFDEMPSGVRLQVESAIPVEKTWQLACLLAALGLEIGKAAGCSEVEPPPRRPA
jgi:hypothetical protein